jgi:cell division septation protein DedD
MEAKSQTRDLFRWMLIAIVALAIIVLIAFARGREHHRGDEVGASAVTPAASGPLVTGSVHG